MERTLQVDVCVVGSGPAGAILASQLAGRGKRIAIIEAGRWQDPAEHGRRLAAGDAAHLALSDPHLHVPLRLDTTTNWMLWALRKVGGNSRIWGGWTPRALEHQFEMKTRFGVGEDWPISYAELEPFYCDAEDELGVSGVNTPGHKPWRSRPFPFPPTEYDYVGKLFAEACGRLGFACEHVQVARSPQAHPGREPCRHCNLSNCMCCQTTARYKSDIHLHRALADRDVTLVTETIAAKLATGSDGRAHSLECYLPDRSRRTIVAGTFVLAANTINNTRLLLLSGLANRSETIGRYFTTHPVIEHLAQMHAQVFAQRSAFSVVSRQFEDGEHLRTAAGFRLLINGADHSPTFHGLRLLEQGDYGASFKRTWKQRATHGICATAIFDTLPHADNRIELDPENVDYFGQAGIKMTYHYSEYDRAGHRLAEQQLSRVLAEMGAAPAPDKAVYDMAHQLGTTRMGTDPATSVVDRDLRMHDLDNVYIASGSVFPNALGPTNPTLTLAALTLRLARHLRERGV